MIARLVATLLPFVLLAALAPAAAGHAAFLESDPAPGARVEQSPARITLEFTEPLVPDLTRATLVAVEDGKRVAAESDADGQRIVVRPRSPLARGAYRIEWRTVSPLDGHTLEGSVGFGLRVAAASGHAIEQSPLARGGWLRVGLRALFYAGLIFFAGGVLGAALLTRGGALGDWLVPSAVARCQESPHGDDLRGRLAHRTIDAGWLAVSAGVATVVADALDAAGALSLRALDEFVFSSVAGVARLGTVVALVAAVAVSARRPGLGAAFVSTAFAGVALAGHANSADARLAALLNDWVHLLAGAVWLGGIAQLAFAWWKLPAPRGLRAAVMRDVLDAFGRLALPAFAVVVFTGLVNALIQLERPVALWTTAYGRLLVVKVALVALVAAASYLHAIRLRPRLLAAADPPGPQRLEQRHWRLLRAEPVVGVAVVAVAALLVAFPLPPRQLADASDAGAAAALPCDPCPQQEPGERELAVAEQVGSRLVAVWARRSGAEVAGEVRLFDRGMRPAATSARLHDVAVSECGDGCWGFRSDRPLAALRVEVSEGGRRYGARLPLRWRVSDNPRAERLLRAAQRRMRELRSLRQEESVTSGPGTIARTTYRLRAPDRMSLVSNDGRVATTVIGRREWHRAPGIGWQESATLRPAPFRTRAWFRWTPFAGSVRLLEARRERGRRVAELALFDRGTPVWYRLVIDLATRRVLRVRMVADGHFMDQRFHAFNQPVTIRPPR